MAYMKDSKGRRLDSFAVADAGDTISEGWSVVSTRSNQATSAQNASVPHMTSRYEHVMMADFDVVALRLVYANIYTGGSGETPFTNPVRVKAGVQLLPSSGSLTEQGSQPVIPATFGGRDAVWVRGGGILISDPVRIGIARGTRYFVKTHASGSRQAAPSAPSVAASNTGGGLVTGAYIVAVTYVFPDGEETGASASTSATISSGTAGSITVTAPAPAASAVGYRVFCSNPGGSTAYATDSGVVPFGTNFVITASMTTTGEILGSAGRVAAGVTATHPRGLNLLGGAGVDQSANGDMYTFNADRVAGGIPTFASATQIPGFSPIGILGLAADGRVHSSIAVIGDSIWAATGDHGFGGGSAWGGAPVRAALAQHDKRAYDLTVAPEKGILLLATGGESAATFADARGSIRTQLALRATRAICDYGTNDLSSGTTATQIAAYLLTIAARFTAQNRAFRQTTILPRTSSTDGWLTLAGQTFRDSCLLESHRRQLNAWILRTTGQSAVSNEAMAGAYASTLGPSGNLYAGGDGVATTFLTRNMFVQGTETVKVAGATKTAGTDYTYVGSVTVGGVACASGVTFATAPAISVTVAASYTAGAGFRSLAGTLAETTDTASAVEVNGSGAAGVNGGFWTPAPGAQVTGTSSGSNTSTTLNDTTKAWATNQWRGYTVTITSDPTTPTAVGQTRCIAGSTSTSLTLGSAWTVTPSSAAVYRIDDAPTIDGIHPATKAHMAMATVLRTSLA